jgi:hypothetical protein
MVLLVFSYMFFFCFVSGKRNIKRWQGSLLGRQSSDLQGYEVLPFAHPGEGARVLKKTVMLLVIAHCH